MFGVPRKATGRAGPGLRGGFPEVWGSSGPQVLGLWGEKRGAKNKMKIKREVAGRVWGFRNVRFGGAGV